MQAIRTTTDGDGILTVWIDVPGKPVNTIGPLVLAELGEVLGAIEKDRPRGVVFASPKARSFVAGADLFEIRKMDRDAVGQFLALGQATFDRIAKLSVPTAAAINGDCLGRRAGAGAGLHVPRGGRRHFDQHRPAGGEARHPARLGRDGAACRGRSGWRRRCR